MQARSIGFFFSPDRQAPCASVEYTLRFLQYSSALTSSIHIIDVRLAAKRSTRCRQEPRIRQRSLNPAHSFYPSKDASLAEALGGATSGNTQGPAPLRTSQPPRIRSRFAGTRLVRSRRLRQPATLTSFLGIFRCSLEDYERCSFAK